MTKATAFRGQPLLVLTTLLIAWVAARASLWQSPFAVPEAAAGIVRTVRSAIRAAGRQPEALPREFLPGIELGDRSRSPATTSTVRTNAIALRDVALPLAFEGIGPTESIAPLSPNMAISQLRMKAPVATRSGPATPLAAPMPVALQRRADKPAPRWSADAWLLFRQDTANSAVASRPSYGRSQAGAVIRYSLAAASPLRPQVYLRASAALAGARDREVAAGISARPVPGLPVRLAVEARLGEASDRTRVRPAAFVVTELPTLRLPLGIRAEVYGQAGYVGGDFATAFADGQARLDRRIFRRGDAELRVGAGVWGGAQEGASRIDTGPTAAFSFRLAGVSGRVAADYRFRVAGDAAPASGPALTLSAGF